MPLSDNYRRQHNDLVSIVTEIQNKMKSSGDIRDNAESISTLFAKLAGKLKIHLAMEDKTLYPRLIESTDTNVSKTAKEFSREMGGISKVFASFMENYSNSEKIKIDVTKFSSDTSNLFTALADRIERENNHLYPLYDKLN